MKAIMRPIPFHEIRFGFDAALTMHQGELISHGVERRLGEQRRAKSRRQPIGGMADLRSMPTKASPYFSRLGRH